MKVTWNWLGEWADLPESPESLAHRLAMLGFPVESLERGTVFDAGIVVGEVLEANPHPNADRLRLCSVNVGDAAPLSIVCGAPNVAAGQRVAVAQVGSTLPDGTKLRRAKIRGVESMGMICSERELGMSEESDGIWVLPGAPAIGTPLSAIAGGGETVLDVEITSNRTDCMSVRGLAREIAAAGGGSLRPPAPLGTTADVGGALPEVTIESPADCARYMARVVRGVTIGPSPEWLRRRLEAAGFRSISNVVDATNYVLREYGQPIHAFDAAKIGGHAIRVRRARRGERIVLLDERELDLDDRVLVIADASKPMALAGVMGGLESGVTDATRDVVLESAYFDPALTDATARILAEVAGGTVVRERVDLWPGRREPSRVRLRHGRLERLLGFPVPRTDVTAALDRLGIAAAGAWEDDGTGHAAEFLIPPHRYDLTIEEDLIEEVARMVGYDRIPLSVRSGPLPESSAALEDAAAIRLRDVACGVGFDQALSTVLVGAIPEEVREGLDEGAIWELQNPISRELKHLRTSLLPGLVRAAAENLHHGVRDVRLVEIGKVFRADPAPLGTERLEAAFVLTGEPIAWDHPGAEKDRLLELRGALEAVLAALGIDSWEARSYHDRRWAAGTAAELVGSDGPLGIVGEVAPKLARALGAERAVWAAIVPVAAVARAAATPRRFRDVPRFPASKRDLAVLVSRNDVTHEDLLRTIRETGRPLLEGARLFDLFRMGTGDDAPRSLAFALEFRVADRTLTDEEVDRAVTKIVRALDERHGASLRGGAPAGTGQSK